MIDDAGNCGMQTKYDKNGYDVEDTSVGPDLKPLPVKDGYVINKNQYDGFGRLRRITFHGVNGEPVLSKTDGYHGIEAEYDEHGNQTVMTYLGKDGKPMSVADGYATAEIDLRCTRQGDSTKILRRQRRTGLIQEDGYHGWEAEYDEHGNEIVDDLSRLGRETDVCSLMAMRQCRMAYDARGKVTRVRYSTA